MRKSIKYVLPALALFFNYTVYGAQSSAEPPLSNLPFVGGYGGTWFDRPQMVGSGMIDPLGYSSSSGSVAQVQQILALSNTWPPERGTTASSEEISKATSLFMGGLGIPKIPLTESDFSVNPSQGTSVITPNSRFSTTVRGGSVDRFQHGPVLVVDRSAGGTSITSRPISMGTTVSSAIHQGGPGPVELGKTVNLSEVQHMSTDALFTQKNAELARDSKGRLPSHPLSILLLTDSPAGS